MGVAVEDGVLTGALTVPVRRVRWQRAIRIIPSRFPPIDLFERVADPEDFEALYEIEGLTNDRLRDEVGELRLVAPEDRVFGPGSTYIMAPFTHPNPAGSRFGDGDFGVYYTARDRATAIAETVYHRERFLSYTAEPALEIEMRVLEAKLQARLHDLRGMRAELPRIYDPDDYAISQRLGRRLRAEGSHGIAYDSVRRAGGQCAAVFRPKALSDCRQTEHLAYVWDGRRIVDVYEKRSYRV
ncbi:MAG TPA: RES family NAD+ phosphorylase [Longimicrobiales bacterium]